MIFRSWSRKWKRILSLVVVDLRLLKPCIDLPKFFIRTSTKINSLSHFPRLWYFLSIQIFARTMKNFQNIAFIPRRHSMFSAFRMGPAASGCGLCDIDWVFFRISQSRVKNWKVLARRRYAYNLGFPVCIIFVVRGLSNFLTLDKLWKILFRCNIDDVAKSAFAGCRTHSKCQKHEKSSYFYTSEFDFQKFTNPLINLSSKFLGYFLDRLFMAWRVCTIFHLRGLKPVQIW